MTAKELQKSFLQHIDHMEEVTVPSEDVEYYLNKAQLELVKAKFKNFEQTQEAINDLENLINKNISIPTEYGGAESSALTNYYTDYITLPEDLLYTISSRSELNYAIPSISFSVVNDKREPDPESIRRVSYNRYIQSDDIYKVLSDPFNTTRIISPVVDIGSTKLTVYTDNRFVVDNVIINYLRIPERIDIKENLNGGLVPQLHEEVVQLAVDFFLNSNTRQT